jgi:hypothetical protein
MAMYRFFVPILPLVCPLVGWRCHGSPDLLVTERAALVPIASAVSPHPRPVGSLDRDLRAAACNQGH